MFKKMMALFVLTVSLATIAAAANPQTVDVLLHRIESLTCESSCTFLPILLLSFSTFFLSLALMMMVAVM